MLAKGFSYIEILVALFIFQISTVTLLQGQLRARQQVLLAQQELTATAFLFEVAAVMQQLPDFSPALLLGMAQPVMGGEDCSAPQCSSQQQAQLLIQQSAQQALQRLADPQLCVSGVYPNIVLQLSWRSLINQNRSVGTADCLRYGPYHQVQIKASLS